ncbi:MAG: transcription termination factor NusA [Mycoplasma sp.]
MSTMNQELLNAITFIADEKKIPRDAVVDALKEAIIKSYMKEYPEEVLDVNINLDERKLEVFQVFNIVENYDDLNDYCEISVEDAKAYYQKTKNNKPVVVGEQLHKYIELARMPKKLVERIVQMFKQRINVQSNVVIYNRWKDRVGQIIYAEVEKNDRHGIVVDLNNGEFGFLSRKDSIPGENLYPGQKYKFYIKEVLQQSSGWPILLTRTNEEFVLSLLKEEVPEIEEGIIEVNAIKRIAGFKTKVCVTSHQLGVEPCGTIIGPQGSRISAVRNEINHEKIEAVQYSDNFEEYLINLCSPAMIQGYKVVAEATETTRKQVILIVKGDQMALLIGKNGTNIRLISQILGIDTDVKTPEEARYENLQYTRLEVKSARQRAFDRILERNRGNADLSLNQFNQPTKEQIQQSLQKDTPVTKTSEVANVVTKQPKPSKESKKLIGGTESLLSQIDNFSFDEPISNEATEFTSLPEKETKPTTKASKGLDIAKLKANEESRKADTKLDLEAKLEQESAELEAKKNKKTQAKKRKTTKTKTNTKKFSSILEEFKNQDNNELLKELEKENDNREIEDLMFDEEYSDEE